MCECACMYVYAVWFPSPADGPSVDVIMAVSVPLYLQLRYLVTTIASAALLSCWVRVACSSSRAERSRDANRSRANGRLYESTYVHTCTHICM